MSTEAYKKRVAAALAAVEGTETDAIEFLADSRAKGWALAESLQEQLDVLRTTTRVLCREANSRGNLSEGGYDARTPLALAYNVAMEVLGGPEVSFTSTFCVKRMCSYEFYMHRRIVPPCPRCGYPEVKETSEEWCRSLGVEPTRKEPK